MAKRLITTFILIVVICNSLSAFPPHRDGEGGCGAECCEAARQDGPAATISAVCCMTECGQSAETATSAASLIDLKPQHPGKLTGCFLSSSNQDSHLQLTRFPILPTRFLYGSPHRYLDIGALLI